MSKIAKFTFNPFQENTYIIYDKSNECIIIDPGCSNDRENAELSDFIDHNELKPVKLINTHCHIDHVLGNLFIAEKYNLELGIHKEELQVLEAVPEYGKMLGLNPTAQKAPDYYIEKGEKIKFGNDTLLEVLYTPGHSPGEICLYNKEDNYVIAGDVLFFQSIGRTDLPGGDYNTLIESIKSELLTLPDSTIVYCGHGPDTTIGREKMSNPFLR